MNPILGTASLAAILSFCVHTFVGGRFAARPLLASTALPRATVWLNYFTWHIVTVHLAIYAAILAAGAFGLLHRQAILLVSILCAAVSITSMAVTLKAGIPPHRFPASYLLGVTAILAFWGAVA